MENLERYIGKRIYIVFDDKTKNPSTKNGTLINVTDTHLILETEKGKKEGIRISDIIRFEVSGGSND